jgi:hypothetical protein
VAVPPCDVEWRAAPDRVRLEERLRATIPPEAIAKAGTYIITVKSEGESLPESQRAHLIVGFRQ